MFFRSKFLPKKRPLSEEKSSKGNVHVESPRTAGVTDKPRPPPLSREQTIGIGTGGKNRRTLVRTASSSTRAV